MFQLPPFKKKASIEFKSPTFTFKRFQETHWAVKAAKKVRELSPRFGPAFVVRKGEAQVNIYSGTSQT